MICGKMYRIESRFRYDFGNELAAYYLNKRLESYGLDTYVMVYHHDTHLHWTGRNIYAVQTGTKFPDERYILCAHFDSMKNSPGADDNASGVAAVLEAARVLSRMEPENTIMYALWDCEESGPEGSEYYIKLNNCSSDNIAGVINLELLGWDSNDDGVMDIHTHDFLDSPHLASSQLADIINTMNTVYELGLAPVIHNPGTWSSDHGNFWNARITAVCFGEAHWAGDSNPYYSSEEDRIDKFNLPYFHKLSKLAVASIGYFALGNTLTYVNEPSPQPYTLILEQNYPNPFNAGTVIPYQVPIESHVELSMFNALGEQVTVLVNERKPAGNYGIRFNGESFPSGLYFYTLSVGGNVLSKKMLLMK
jgi:hypothetical protein